MNEPKNVEYEKFLLEEAELKKAEKIKLDLNVSALENKYLQLFDNLLTYHTYCYI